MRIHFVVTITRARGGPWLTAWVAGVMSPAYRWRYEPSVKPIIGTG